MLLTVEGMRLKLGCEDERDAKTAASIRITQAHSEQLTQDNNLQFASTQAVKTAERLSQTTRAQQVERANAEARLEAIDAQEAEQQNLADAQKSFVDAAQRNLARESQAAAQATSTKQNAVELAIATWRSQRETARKQTHLAFVSAEQQMAQGLARVTAEKSLAIEAAEKKKTDAIPALRKRLTDFEHATKQLSATLKSSGKSQAQVVAEYDERYKEQDAVAAEVHAKIKKIEADTLAAKEEANTRYSAEVAKIEKTMQDTKVDAVAEKARTYKASKAQLQQKVDAASNAAASDLKQQHTQTQTSLEAAQTTRDRARAEAVAVASDAMQTAKEVARQEIASTYQSQREHRANEALDQASRFREQALSVQTLGPSLD
jgi:hypothetical protein